MRGTQGQGAGHAVHVRFIPAFAGNARSRQCSGKTRSVHPRVCGERSTKEIAAARGYGSSPRLRGTLPGVNRLGHGRRFIPAFAGNASAAMGLGARLPVHPRVCGERATTRRLPRSAYGSSPRLRGTLIPTIADDDDDRFIPAFAGNATQPVVRPQFSPVHPRVCGERVDLSGGGFFAHGSSPRLRGTLKRLANRVELHRFIPAFAGNARPLRPPSRAGPVHPRVCGERLPFCDSRATANGSSPRLRGTQLNELGRLGGRRFIPAFAGNAESRRCRSNLPAVHPRVCGERAMFCGKKIVGNGSSPRLRGTQAQPHSKVILIRFIPAFAGNAIDEPQSQKAYSVHPRVCGERRIHSHHL